MIKPTNITDTEQKQLDSGVAFIFDKINSDDKKMGRPFKENKKIQIGLKLPPWLNDWMNRQPESKAKLIERALIEYYQIPEHLNPDCK